MERVIKADEEPPFNTQLVLLCRGRAQLGGRQVLLGDGVGLDGLKVVQGFRSHLERVIKGHFEWPRSFRVLLMV